MILLLFTLSGFSLLLLQQGWMSFKAFLRTFDGIHRYNVLPPRPCAYKPHPRYRVIFR